MTGQTMFKVTEAPGKDVGRGIARLDPADIHALARQAAPCIIFFDEIDALVSSRGTAGGAVAERVLSQLLTEMDGIEELRRVVVLGATNRLDLIDPALLRPGRFDLQLELPDRASRRQILAVHTRKRPVAEDVDLEVLAAGTDGFSGADLHHLCNRAALAFFETAARYGLEFPSGTNIESAAWKDALIERESCPQCENQASPPAPSPGRALPEAGLKLRCLSQVRFSSNKR